MKTRKIQLRTAFAVLCLAAHVGKAAQPPREMTIMTFNIRHCSGSDKQLDVKRTAAAIQAVRPRFAALQEVDVRTKRSQLIDEPEELARLTGMKATFGKAIDFSGGGYGNALLSQDEPLSVKKVPLPGGEPRMLLLAEFEDCVVGCTHLSNGAEKERRASAGLIREAIASYKKPVFVCGDWNARPNSNVLAEMKTFLTLLSRTDQNTFHGAAAAPLTDPSICIDYIAVDSAHADAIRVLEQVVVPDTETSDHKPVWVRIAMQAE